MAKKDYQEVKFWYAMLPDAQEDLFESDNPQERNPFGSYRKSGILSGNRIRYFDSKKEIEENFFHLAAEARSDEFIIGEIIVKRGKKASLKRSIDYEE